jgi:hypothetical protein
MTPFRHIDGLASGAHMSDMADPRKAAATVEKIEPTMSGGRRITIRNVDHTTETVITSSSTVEAVNRAVKTYSRALRNLAKK